MYKIARLPTVPVRMSIQIFFAIILWFSTFVAYAEFTNFGVARIGESCKINPSNFPEITWTKADKWVWKEICEGRVADLNKRLGI